MASKWATPNAVATVFAAAAMNGLASNNAILSAAYDNATNADIFADFIVAAMWQTAPTAGDRAFVIQLLGSADGTNYPSQEPTSDDAHMSTSQCYLETRAPSTTVLEYLVTPILLIPPGSFKVILWNRSANQVHTTDSTMFVKMRPIQMSTTAT